VKTATRTLGYGSGPPDDGLEREWDTCPTCGNRRWQLILIPDRFHCDRCCISTARNDEPLASPEPEQIGMDFGAENITAKYNGDQPPIDESQGHETDRILG